MKLRVSKDQLMTFAVFWAVVSSGSQFFMNQNMILTDLIMLLISFVILLKLKLLTKINRFIFAIIIGYLFANTILNFNNGIYVNDVIIIISKLVFVIVIASNISLDDFIYKYVRIMIGLSILSLLCFSFIQITRGGPLPFQAEYRNSSGAVVYSTFYHTVGWQPLNGIHYYTLGYGYFTRNAGIFWEPGAFQVFLNFALVLYLAKDQLFTSDKWKKAYFPILVITVITTLSTTAFICLICNLVFFIFKKEKVNKKSTKLIIIAIALVAIVLVENYFGVIEEKLTNHGASYITRMTDTTVGLELLVSSLDKFLIGYGVFAKNYLIDLLKSYGVYNISNGLIGFALNIGIIGLLYYLWHFTKTMIKVCNHKIILTCIALFEFCLMASSESIMLAPIFLLFIFSFNERNNAAYHL